MKRALNISISLADRKVETSTAEENTSARRFKRMTLVSKKSVVWQFLRGEPLDMLLRKLIYPISEKWA